MKEKILETLRRALEALAGDTRRPQLQPVPVRVNR